MKQKIALIALITLFVACKKEQPFLEVIDGDLIQCFKNKHVCVGIINTPVVAKFVSGKFSFNDGTDYQNYWDAPYEQVNKLFGSTDCGEVLESRENSAMVGFRHLANTNNIELVGYVHKEDADRNGYNFRHAHLMVVPRMQATDIKIEARNGFYKFSAGSSNDLIMKRFCDTKRLNGRKISTWFGGQKTAPVNLRIGHGQAGNMENNFPKSLRISDQDDLCKSSEDPLNYLKNHSSGIWKDYETSCQGTLQVNFIGCNRQMGRSVGQSENSEGAFQYEVDCR
jgi:hypothetical protein